MESKQKQFFVRVQVGNCSTGQRGISKPIKTMPIYNTTVEKVFAKIKKLLSEEIKKNMKKNGKV